MAKKVGGWWMMAGSKDSYPFLLTDGREKMIVAEGSIIERKLWAAVDKTLNGALQLQLHNSTIAGIINYNY